MLLKKVGEKILVLIWIFDCYYVFWKINFYGIFVGVLFLIFCLNLLYKVYGWYKVLIWIRVNVLFIFYLYLKNGVKIKGYLEIVFDVLYCRWYGNVFFYLVIF